MARLIQVVKDDHRRLIQLRQRILTSSQNDGLLKAQVVEELQQHISAESQILLPLISERLQDGSKRSENLRHTHEHVRSCPFPSPLIRLPSTVHEAN